MSKTLEKYIIKIPSINLPYSKEFETLLTSSKKAVLWHDNMYSQTVFQQLLGIGDKGPKLSMDDLQMYLNNHSLAARS